MLKYLKSLIKTNSEDSSKNFSLILSTLSGVVISLCVSFCLVWDVCSNDYIKTDLDQLGLFILCVGGYMIGGGVNKAVETMNKRKQNGVQSK